MKNLLKKWNDSSLVLRILGGLIIGVVLGLAVPQAAPIGLLGDLFVGALKAVAPLLVLFLVMTALARHREGQKTNMSRVILLYLLGTFIDGCVAVITSFLFPVTLKLTEAQSQTASPGGIGEVLNTLLMNLVSNPVDALVNANYIGILAWAVLLGIALRKAGDGTKRAWASWRTQSLRWCAGSSAAPPSAFSAWCSTPSPSWESTLWPAMDSFSCCWWGPWCLWPWWSIRSSPSSSCTATPIPWCSNACGAAASPPSSPAAPPPISLLT